MFRYKDYFECWWFWKTCAGHLCWETGPTTKNRRLNKSALLVNLYLKTVSEDVLHYSLSAACMKVKTDLDYDTGERWIYCSFWIICNINFAVLPTGLCHRNIGQDSKTNVNTLGTTRDLACIKDATTICFISIFCAILARAWKYISKLSMVENLRPHNLYIL